MLQQSDLRETCSSNTGEHLITSCYIKCCASTETNNAVQQRNAFSFSCACLLHLSVEAWAIWEEVEDFHKDFTWWGSEDVALGIDDTEEKRMFNVRAGGVMLDVQVDVWRVWDGDHDFSIFVAADFTMHEISSNNYSFFLRSKCSSVQMSPQKRGTAIKLNESQSPAGKETPLICSRSI